MLQKYWCCHWRVQQGVTLGMLIFLFVDGGKAPYMSVGAGIVLSLWCYGSVKNYLEYIQIFVCCFLHGEDIYI